jgi:hypothetical protein
VSGVSTEMRGARVKPGAWARTRATKRLADVAANVLLLVALALDHVGHDRDQHGLELLPGPSVGLQIYQRGRYASPLLVSGVREPV